MALEIGDKILIFNTTGGSTAIKIGTAEIGGNIAIINTVSGKAVAIPLISPEVGDKILILNDAGGKTVAVSPTIGVSICLAGSTTTPPKIYKSIDNALTFDTVYTAPSGSGTGIGFISIRENICLAGSTGSGARLFRSSDLGDTWAIVASGVWSHAVMLDSTIGIGTIGNLIKRSTDGGLNWSTAYTGATNFERLVYLGDGIILAGGTDGNIYRSPDSGFTWVSVYASPSQKISDFCYLGNNIVLAGGSGNSDFPFYTRQGYIYRSTDRGLTWSNLGKLVDDERVYFGYDRPNRVFVHLAPYSLLLFLSTDYGLTFPPQGDQMLNGYGCLDYSGNNVLLFIHGDYNLKRYHLGDVTYSQPMYGTTVNCIISSYRDAV